jgi:hypothetical protein
MGLLASVALLLIVPSAETARLYKREGSSKKMVIEVAVFRGDPFGSREAGTVKVLANPFLEVMDGKTVDFCIGVGESVPLSPALFPESKAVKVIGFKQFGYHYSLSPYLQEDGRVVIIVEADHSKPMRLAQPSGEAISFEVRRFNARRILKQGESFKTMCGEEPTGEYVWIEVKVQEKDKVQK